MSIRLVSRSTISLPLPNFAGSLKFANRCTTTRVVGVGQRLRMTLLILVTDLLVALAAATISAKPVPSGMVDQRRRRSSAAVFVGDVFDKQQDQDVVLVLAGIHAATQFIARFPKEE